MFPEPDAPRRPLDDHERELSALKAVAVACTEEDDEERLIARVTDIICAAINAPSFGIDLYHGATGRLVDHPSARRGVSARQLSLTLGEGIVGQVARTGRPMRVGDVRQEPAYVLNDPATRSELAVPLLVRDQLIGVINSESPELDYFTVEDERLLVILAGLLAPAVARLRILVAVREQEDKYRSLFNSVPVGVFQTVPDGRILDANRTLLEMLGAGTLEELRTALARDGCWWASPDVRRDMERELALRGHTEREVPWRKLDGTEFWVALWLRTCRDGKGAVQYDGSALDITERRAVAEEGETLRERLRQSEKFEAIGHLAGGVAHDFNNQLAAILGFAETLEELSEGEIQRRFAQNIVRSCQRAADLTKKLLAFARKGSILSEPVDLHQIILEVVALLNHSLDKRITLSTSLAAERSVVMGDPTQLQNAFMNMAINSRDAMPGGGSLAFTTRVRDLDEGYCRRMPYEIVPGTYLEVSVADSGVGMDAGTLRHIFEPFFTTKGVGKGTGLGLASVYGTVKQHRGHIQASSAPGQGACFTVYLPLSDQPMDKQPIPAATEPHRGNAHILFVDDELLVAEVSREILGTLQYQVTVCRDGQEAVDFYREAWRTVDLVILDMVMPRMGGKDAFVALRAINPEVKVLLISGYSVEGEAQQLLNGGARGFLQKPYRRADLAREVDKALAS